MTIITDGQRQALIDYLQTKPYGEVYRLIAMVMSLPNEEQIINGQEKEDGKVRPLRQKGGSKGQGA